MKKEEFITSPLGILKIVSDKENLLNLEFSFNNKQKESASKSLLTKKVEKQLQEYFNGKRKSFEIDIVLNGTDFQKKVWRIVSKIPYGKTLTYQDVAIKLGNKNLSRAVGQALKSNRIAIIIPCHRVVAKNGLGGYSGKNHLELKRKLLKLEGVL